MYLTGANFEKPTSLHEQFIEYCENTGSKLGIIVQNFNGAYEKQHVSTISIACHAGRIEKKSIDQKFQFCKIESYIYSSFLFFWEKRQIRNWAWKHTLLIENSHVEYCNLMTRVPFQFFWLLKCNKIVFIEKKKLLLTNRQTKLIVGKQKRKIYKIFKKGLGF